MRFHEALSRVHILYFYYSPELYLIPKSKKRERDTQSELEIISMLKSHSSYRYELVVWNQCPLRWGLVGAMLPQEGLVIVGFRPLQLQEQPFAMYWAHNKMSPS